MMWIPLLLADRSVNLRCLVLTKLLHYSEEESEVKELISMRETDPIVRDIIRTQSANGSWSYLDGERSQDRDRVRITSFALLRLGYLGFPSDHPVVEKGVEFIFNEQHRDGAWPMPAAYDGISEPKRQYTMTPLQTSIPLLGIAACGHATDERAEAAFEWLLSQRLDDGSWPAGKIGKVFGYQAGYRKMPHTKWGCRTNTTLALTCLALHPSRRKSEEAKRALDLLLSRETRDRRNLGFNVARIVGFEKHRGNLTYHANFDPGLVLDLCWRVGADKADSRVRDLIDWALNQQNRYGLWQYEQRPEASRWVTYDILSSLSRIDESTDWYTSELRTSYQSYSRKPKRF
jgi:hypothetical protein